MLSSRAWHNQLHQDGICCFERVLETALYNTAVVRLPTNHLRNQASKACWTLLGEVRMKSEVTFFYGLLHMYQPSKTYIHQLCANTWMPLIRSVKSNGFLGWTMKESRQSVLLTCLDYDKSRIMIIRDGRWKSLGNLCCWYALIMISQEQWLFGMDDERVKAICVIDIPSLW